MSRARVSELAKVYDYLTNLNCPHTEWKLHLWDQDSDINMGVSIISDCLLDKSGVLMGRHLESIADGLGYKKDSFEYDDAKKACLLLQELYKHYPPIEQVLNKTFESEQVVFNGLKLKNGDPYSNYTIEGVLIANRVYKEVMGMIEERDYRGTSDITRPRLVDPQQNATAQKKEQEASAKDQGAVKIFFAKHPPGFGSYWRGKDQTKITMDQVIEHALGANDKGFLSGHSGAGTKKALMEDYHINFKSNALKNLSSFRELKPDAKTTLIKDICEEINSKQKVMAEPPKLR